jgi:activator of HSP90 ATPase
LHDKEIVVKTKTIEQTVTFDARPRVVYDLYVDAKKHAAFTGARASLVKKPGGKMRAWDGYVSGVMLLLEPGKRIVQTWKSQTWPKGRPESILDIRLKPRGKGTELTMIHAGIPTASLAKGFRSGWHTSYWKPIARHLKNKGAKRG